MIYKKSRIDHYILVFHSRFEINFWGHRHEKKVIREWIFEIYNPQTFRLTAPQIWKPVRQLLSSNASLYSLIHVLLPCPFLELKKLIVHCFVQFSHIVTRSNIFCYTLEDFRLILSDERCAILISLWKQCTYRSADKIRSKFNLLN